MYNSFIFELNDIERYKVCSYMKKYGIDEYSNEGEEFISLLKLMYNNYEFKELKNRICQYEQDLNDLQDIIGEVKDKLETIQYN